MVTDTSGLRASSAAYRRMLSHGRRMTLLGATSQLQDGAALQAIGAAYRRLLRRGRRMTLSGADGALHEQLTRLRLDHHLLPGARPPTTGSRPTTGT